MNKQLKPIPAFASEAEERAFWESHDSTEYVDWDKAQFVVFPNLQMTKEVATAVDWQGQAPPEDHGMPQPNFALSALYALDNLEVMRGMDSETVDLIYLDPPFNSKRMYQGMSGSKAQAHRFRDTWSWNDAKQEWLDQLENDYPDLRRQIDVAKAHSDGMGGYLAFMAPRIIEMHRILMPDGSLYLHCDPNANSYLRILLDLVFGSNNHRNEIVWHYGKMANTSRNFPSNHDTIYRYSKGDDWTFNPLKGSESEYRARFARYLTGNQVLYGSVSQSKDKLILRRAKKVESELGRSLMDSDVLFDFDVEYKIQSDVIYESIIKGNAKERTGWNTQKPLALLERIIEASSNEGDIVFDPFCGCGTALVAAENLGRRWVGADDDVNAIYVVRERVASLKGILADQPQFQSVVFVLRQAPARTEAATAADGVLKDPTGIIIPKMPSDKMSNAAIRDQLMEWQQQLDGNIQCPGCGECLKPRHFHVDHINPKSAGGTNRIDNRILLCGACNIDKGNTKALPQLWNEQKIRGKRRQEMQKHVTEIQDQARAHVQQMDAGVPVQALLR